MNTTVMSRFRRLQHEVGNDQAAATLVLAELLAELLAEVLNQNQPQVVAQAAEPPQPTTLSFTLPPLPPVELQAVQTDSGKTDWRLVNWPGPKIHEQTL